MKSQTILIVEDNLQMRRVLKTLLGQACTVCHECSDGAAARAVSSTKTTCSNFALCCNPNFNPADDR